MDELAAQYGFAYSTTKADIDEQALGCRKSDPQELVVLLARAKARAIMDRLSGPQSGFLLTCDQVQGGRGELLKFYASNSSDSSIVQAAVSIIEGGTYAGGGSRRAYTREAS